VQDIQNAERATANRDIEAQIRAILIAANIDPDAEFTRQLLLSAGDTPEAQLANLTAPDAALTLRYWVDNFPDVMLNRPTPYSEALADNEFLAAPAPVGTGHIPPSQAPPSSTGYETSDATGAIRFDNGTIVTADGGIIFDPSRVAPGSAEYLRIAAGWDAATLADWKAKLVAYGYMTKEEAKGEGFTVQMRGALETYWRNYYINGGKPISAEGGGGGSQVPLIDYKDFSAQIQNDTRDQLRRILGVEPTEEQVRAQTQFIMRTATDMQRKFRSKDYGAPGSMALTNATEQAISNIETSPYAQDVRENTQLADSLQNAAFVSRSLLS
jgi:hypothetical protein